MIDWWPKIRPGGVVAGHDFEDGITPHGVFNVRTAVLHFVAAVNVPYFTTGEGSTFYFIKPDSS